MSENEEVFISYSHDSVEHVKKVLELSNKLRSEGIDCVLDQYEVSPLEGWPRWMDKKIRDAKYVLLVCTEAYYNRVMGEEKDGSGLGVRWEGNLIYQHFYNAGSINTRFIPLVFYKENAKYIPTPLQGTTFYCIEEDEEYESLYRRLTDQPKIMKPELGKRRPLPEKPVKTNPAMYITSPIDVDLWNEAKWSATFFVCPPNHPPALGLAFRNKTAAVKIFEGWHERYGKNDKFEELRISIIEGNIDGEEEGYSVHIGVDPYTVINRYKSAGYKFDDGDLLTMISRINRMNPPSGSKNLDMFKYHYRLNKTYYLVPGILSENGTLSEPLYKLGIFKNKILFRNSSDIHEGDLDSAVTSTGNVKRNTHK